MQMGCPNVHRDYNLVGAKEIETLGYAKIPFVQMSK
jgi:hypothetical protein